MKRTLQLVMYLFLISLAWKAIWQTETNIQALNNLSVKFNTEFERNRAEVIEFVRINNLPVRFETEDASLKCNPSMSFILKLSPTI